MNVPSNHVTTNNDVAYIVTIEASLLQEEFDKTENKVNDSTAISAPSSSLLKNKKCASPRAQSTSTLKPKFSNILMRPFLHKNKSKHLDYGNGSTIDLYSRPKATDNKERNPFINDVGINTEMDHKNCKNISFFRKLISKQPSRLQIGENKIENQSDIQTTNRNDNVQMDNIMNLTNSEVCFGECAFNVDAPSQQSDTIMATYFKSSNTAKSMSELKSILGFMKELRESEAYLMNILSKYIRDENFQKQLFDAVNDYSKKRLEAEKRSQNFANEMWQHQIDIHRLQEKAFQDSLNQIIRQNRQLQEDYDNLIRKSENLLIQSSKLNMNSSESVNLVNASSEKLQQKLSSMTSHISVLESEIQTLQRDNFSLQDQVQEFASQAQEYKIKFERSCNEQNLEKIILEKRLEEIQKKINVSEEAGHILIADLENLKRQTSIILSINWDKFKNCGSDPSDLIHMCRSFINELLHELIATKCELQLRDKDIESVRDNNKRLQESLQKSSSELDKIYKKMEACIVYEHETNDYKEKNSDLERKNQNLTNQLDNLRQRYEEMKKELDSVNSEIKYKNVHIEEKESVLNTYKSESEALKSQIDGLNLVLKATGAGDVARELSNMQEKYSTLQSQYYQVLAQKSFLSEQMGSCNSERDVLLHYQHTYYQHLQVLQNDLGLLSEENQNLKDQLRAEQSMVSALQNEKARYLDEKSILKSMYQHYKNEIAKVQKLELIITEMNKETSRLTIIAEYNKQLGEKLKSEVEKRDQTIIKLQNNLQVLNNIQIEDTKDKVALCAELTEVCTIKDKLNNSLILEMQKNVHLDDVKKELEKGKFLQLKAFEDMQNTERLALKELLEDFKQVVLQRDQLSMSYNESSKQIIELQKMVTCLKKNCNEATLKQNEKESKINNLEEQLKKKDCELDITLKKAENESASYENTLQNLYKYTDQMKKEKENLENSVKYLQSNTQKLYNDLNEAKRAEMAAKDELIRISKANENVQKTLTESNLLLEATFREKEEFKTEIKRLNEINTSIINDFQGKIDDFVKSQQILHKELHVSKQYVNEGTKRISALLQAMEGMESQINFLSNKLWGMHQEKFELIKFLQEIEKQVSFASDAYKVQTKLQCDLEELEKHHEMCMEQINSLSKEFESVQSRISKSLKKHNEESLLYRKQMTEISCGHKVHKENVNETLQIIIKKINDIMTDYEEDKKEHGKLSNAHKLLAAKLMNALKMLVDEKVTRQNAELKTFEIHQKYNTIKAENVNLKQSLELFETELYELRKITGDLRNDKNYLKEALIDAQKAHRDSISKCELLEQELATTRRICSDLTQKKDDEKGATSKELVLRQADSEERIVRLKEELNDRHNMIMQLRKEIAKLQQDITTLEFQKCELNLRLHETHGKYLTEANLHKELRNTHQQILSKLLEFQEKGVICKHICDEIFFTSKTNSSNLYENSEHSLTSSDSKFSFLNERPQSGCSFSSN